MHPPIVQIVGLTKTFKDFWRRPNVWAVRDLNLDIHPGEIFGLLGPNGSGKSTTIKVMLGLLYPTRGRVSLFGRPPTDVSIKNRIGYLPEESYLYQFLNARETLDFYGRLFRLPRRERRRRSERLLEMVGLTREARRRVGEYSKGMARRIGLATALINDPDLLILDEPTSGLDPLGTRLIKDLIVDLCRRGKTIILSSHLLADVEDCCDRVAILYGGMQRAVGRTHDLLSRSELTQITTETLDEETLEEMRDVLRRRGHDGRFDVSSPSDNLESFFLRIVRQAQEEKVVTSGASVVSGQVPAFLKGEEEQDVIGTLVSSGKESAGESESEPEAEPAPVEPVADGVLIDDLVSGRIGEALPAAGASPPAVEKPDVDRGVIDSLVDRAGPSEASGREPRENDG